MQVDDITKAQLDAANIDPASEWGLTALYDEMLDECHGVVTIAGYEYSTSMALRVVDPVAYRCGQNDWLDSEVGETLYCLHGEYYHRRNIDELLEELEQSEP